VGIKLLGDVGNLTRVSAVLMGDERVVRGSP
jgi:hypothetical protein